MAIFSKFFGRTVSEAAGVAAGLAVAAPLRPVVQLVENETWAIHPDRPVNVTEAAAIVAEDVEKDSWGVKQASWTGFDEPTFRAILGEVLNAPGIGELFEAYRRDLIDDAAFEHGLRKAKLEKRWDEPLKSLKAQRLGPDVIARAIQRGLVTDPGLLPKGPPSATGKVPAFPVFNVDPLAEAAAYGIDRDRLGVEVGLVGNPASPDLAARMVFRNIIDRIDFDRAIAEGNTRNEWADVLFDGFRQILTAHDGIEDHLRGWSDEAAMYAQTARHGMSKEDTDVLFRITGRPISFHQVFIGLRRGGKYDGATTEIDDAFLKSLRESNIRPEWYNLAWAQRYNYPAAFVLRGLTQSGDISQAESEQILLYEGWEPKLAATVSKKWAATKVAGADKHVTAAETSFITAIRKAFIGGAITDAQGVEQLALTSLSAAAQAGVLDYWRKNRALELIPPPPAAPPVVA